MEKFKIANLRVDMNILYPRLKQQALKYKTKESTPADITIQLSKTFYEKRQKENIHLSISDIEYLYAGFYFYNKLLEFNGFMLHSSAICKDNFAYLFSADSGVGKSTQASNWMKYFKNETIFYINDDKPAIRKMEDTFYCCGTPFSGKMDLSSNCIVPVKAIIFIKRGQVNKIKKMPSKEAIHKIFKQTIHSLPEDKMDKLLNLLNDLLNLIPIYELECNMDIESAKVAYEYIQNDTK